MAFISLGLPDSLLGSGWPVMQTALNVPISYAGIITVIISVCTVISALLSDRLTRKMGTGLITATSILITAVALLGFSLSNKFYMICLLAIPYGFGAGAVDAAMNNYVALHYNANQMSWLHCFWGVGALISPYVMGACLTNNLGWQSGYKIVFLIQLVISALLFATLPLWKKQAQKTALELESNSEMLSQEKPCGILGALRIKGVKPLIIGFFAYCAFEQTGMLWASSYLAEFRGFTKESAASFGALVYIGITAGRAICGFIANKIGDKQLIRIGSGTVLLGIVLIAIPQPVQALPIAGLVLLGFGCAPIYPSIIHSTPYRFGKVNSQAIIGIQMAFAYIGITLMPPLFGILAQYASIGLYPVYIFALLLSMVLALELTNVADKKRSMHANS